MAGNYPGIVKTKLDKVDTVMRGLVPRIHVLPAGSKAWMAATSAAMTRLRVNLIGKCSSPAASQADIR